MTGLRIENVLLVLIIDSYCVVYISCGIGGNIRCVFGDGNYLNVPTTKLIGVLIICGFGRSFAFIHRHCPVFVFFRFNKILFAVFPSYRISSRDFFELSRKRYVFRNRNKFIIPTRKRIRVLCSRGFRRHTEIFGYSALFKAFRL